MRSPNQLDVSIGSKQTPCQASTAVQKAFKQSCSTLDLRQRNLRKPPNVQYFRNRELVAVFVLKSCSYSKWLMPEPFPATHPLPQSAPCEAQGPAQGEINSGKGGWEWDRFLEEPQGAKPPSCFCVLVGLGNQALPCCRIL